MEYKFLDDKNTMVITTRKVIEGKSCILLVSHDKDDGMWEFLDGEDVNKEDAVIVSIFEMIQIDESLNKLYDLPLGWIAHRQNRTAEWIRSLD